ncbi:MAG: Acyl-CoA dehydrogenase [Pseudonocardiales bacterium]|nr:Acyl-CoA dehydrogenase [Pseudonocardiales bacterium]
MSAVDEAPVEAADEMLISAADDLFSDLCTHEAVQAAERDGWAPQAWAAVAEMGLPWIGVPEAAGGQGGSLLDALAVLKQAGRHALALPLAETGLLGGWLLASAGLPLPTAPISLAPSADHLALDGSMLTGTAYRVPWARSAERIVVLLPEGDGHLVASVDASGLRIELETNVAGEPRDTVHFDSVPLDLRAPAGEGVTLDALRLRGALTRVALMAGALDRVRDTTVDYTSQREQFGKPLNRFQAIQAHLVFIAQQAAIMGMAAEMAGRAAQRGDAEMEIASAKVLAHDAVQIATRSAHQAHGAMGMTQEYSLHQATRRLWSWRQEYGDGTYWSTRIGRAAAQLGADSLYPLVTGGTAFLRS